jgi:RNA polymerase sigma-70 factor, ECF subfamily
MGICSLLLRVMPTDPFTKVAPGLPDRFIRLPLSYNISPIDQDHSSSAYNASLGFIQRARLNSSWNSKGMDLMTDIARLLEPEIPRLRRYARALTRDTTRADDLVQNCLARAVAKQHLWQEGTDLRAWLFTILHNQHVNDVRRSAREGVAVPVEEMAAALPVEANAIDALALRDLHRAMGRLPEEQRQVILLVGLEGLRYEQAAQILDVPVGTVRSRLSRGRDTLRVLMGMPEKTAETLSRGKVRAQRQRAA